MRLKLDAVYLHKLFILHMNRVQEFKQLAVARPRPLDHDGPQASGSPCSENNSETWNELWASVCAFLTWSSTPDMKSATIRSMMPSIVNRLSCEVCKAALVDRFDKLCESWEAVKVKCSFNIILDNALMEHLRIICRKQYEQGKTGVGS